MDWIDEMIWECHMVQVKPNGIMKIINRFILVRELPDDFISADAVRTRLNKIYQRKIAEHKEKLKGFKYLLADGRKDKTLMPKNRIQKEEHLTFVSRFKEIRRAMFCYLAI